MNTMLRTAVVAALCVSGTAAADVICKGCKAAFPGAYLGAYWPGDRGTFKGARSISPGIAFDEFYVLDLNANGKLALAASGRLTNFRAELYSDAGSICITAVCSQVVLGELLACTRKVDGVCVQIDPAALTGTDARQRQWSLSPKLVAGRYVLRIIGRKPVDGGNYSGRAALRRH